MAADEKWYFTKEQLQNTPSRKCGFDADKELSYRQQAANFIQDMGQKLQVSQLCINTAIVYMHRFYMFHSFTHFPWNTIAAASFFLAAKVEEQPRKLEHVIRIANHCLHRDQQQAFDTKSEQYAAQSQDLVFNENVLLQTLGFDVAIDHPHTHVVRCCHLVRASKDLAQTSYFMASNSLHLTTMCLQYKPTVVACFCIHLACKWSNWQIPKSNEGKDWFFYVDKSVTSDLLEQLTGEFLKIFDKCPSRLKRKISSITISQHTNTGDPLHGASSSNSPFSDFLQDPDSRNAKLHYEKEGGGAPTFHRSHHEAKPSADKAVRPHDPAALAARDREYREKKERERLEREKAAKAAATVAGKHMPHHRPPPSINPAAPVSSNLVAPPPSSNSAKLHHQPNIANGRDRDRERDRDRDREREQRERERYAAQHKTEHPELNKDPSRQKPVVPDGKMPIKQHDPNRHRDRHREQSKPQLPPSSVTPTVNSASVPPKPTPPVSAPPTVSTSSAQDKNSYLNKQINSTSQRHKSPFSDAKSVPAVPAPVTVPLAHKANGSGPEHEASPPPPPQPPQQKKPASLFSPEKTPPREVQQRDVKKAWVPPPLSPFSSPPPQREKTTSTPVTPSTATPTTQRRPRTSSSSSEPELRLVVTKLDKTPGFENIIRDSKMGIKLPKVPDIIQPICDRKSETTEPSISKELKPPDIIKPFNTSLLESPVLPTISQPAPLIPPPSQPLVNGIETDPAAISTLLKEAAPTLNHHLAPEASAPVPAADVTNPSTSSLTVPDHTTAATTPASDKHKSPHHHKSEKKKKKDKHKHKDKDKSRDEKKKKHKDKDKERHKSKTEKSDAPPPDVEVPLKITISKDKLQPVLEAPTPGTGLKVKISKDRLKTDVIEPLPPAPAPSALKIKISKDQIQYNSVVDSSNSVLNSSSSSSGGGSNSSSRKRERDKTSGSTAPPAKVSKSSYSSSGGGRESSRQNGRSSYNKVAQLGDGEAAQVRLAESKYHSKGTSKTS